MSSLSPEAVLRQRGIFEPAMDAGWYPQKMKIGITVFEGWGIPVTSPGGEEIGTRWKNGLASPPEGTKVRWYPSKPKTEGKSIYYLLPDTLKSIEAQEGKLFLAGGEPDAIAFRAAGAFNTLCWLDGEVNVPKTFAEDMAQFGVSEIIYFPDRDDAGIRAARKVISRLRDSGIALTIRELPYNSDSGGDINRFWIDCGFIPSSFWDKLRNTLRLKIPPDPLEEQRKLMKKRETYGGGVGRGNKFTEYVSAIKIHLEGRQQRREGNIIRYQCISPIHSDDSPSARISKDVDAEFGIYVCSCGAHSWDIVGTWANLGTFKEWVTERYPNPGHSNGRTRYEEPPSYYGEEPPYDDKDAPSAKASPPKPKEPRDILAPGITDPYIPNGLFDYGINQETIDLDKVLFSSDDAADLYTARKTGLYVMPSTPVIFPFRAFHHLGGLGQVATAGDIYGFLGLSGFGKTSFLEALIDISLQNKQHCLMISPEIPWWKFVDRFVQRWEGPTVSESLLDDLDRIEKQDGNSILTFGQALGKEQKAKALFLANWMKTFEGKLFVLDQFGANVMVWLASVDKALRNLRAEGKIISRIFLDYIQLMTPPEGWMGKMSYEEMITRFKALLFKHQAVGYVTSQVRKSDAAKVLSGGGTLGQDSGQNLRPDQFKFYATMTPGMKEAEYDPDKMVFANYTIFGVDKNSEGSFNVEVEIETLWHQMKFKDHIRGELRENWSIEPRNG